MPFTSVIDVMIVLSSAFAVPFGSVGHLDHNGTNKCSHTDHQPHDYITCQRIAITLATVLVIVFAIVGRMCRIAFVRL